MAKKRTILIDGWVLENTLEERKGVAKKLTILIDGWGLENALEEERKIGLENTLF